MPFEKAAILAALSALDRKDPRRKVFGAVSHQYRLNPPLRVRTIEAFEQKHQVTLPEDYRYFLTAVGNGGAGPYYGLFRFGEHDDGHDFCKWAQGHMVGDLTKAFPHARAWNLPRSFWAKQPEPGPETPLEEEDRLNEGWDKQLEQHYWKPDLMNGAIPICHLGCALRQWLVINGPQKGFVWCDDRADDRGIYPLRNASGKRLTFAAWYLAWLQNPKVAMEAS